MIEVIDSREEYLQAITAIGSGVGPIAIDAERASGFRYSQRAYLIQIFRRNSGTFLFDPPMIGNFTELNQQIANQEWILHAASQDLDCLKEVGLSPTKIFDTELAARLLGLPRVGLGTVVEELLGVHLAKEHSAANWSTRPLPQSWLTYAALDVELLVDLRDVLEQRLTQAGKIELASQEFDAVLHAQAKEAPLEPWRRMSGLHSIRDGRRLAVARQLWLARDQYAREIDTAPGRLVPDSSLIAAAAAMPRSKRELSDLRSFTGRASRSELNRWWSAIEAGMTTEELPALQAGGDSLPPPRSWPDRNPEAHRRLTMARAAVSDVSAELELPVENLLKPSLLRQLAWAPPEPLELNTIRSMLQAMGARSWQIDATAQGIFEGFVEAGQAGREPEEALS